MLMWLMHHFGHWFQQLEPTTAGESRVFITSRAALASLTAFVLSVCSGPIAIRWLKSKFRERIASDSATLNALHSSKEGTPTMGGLFILGAILVSLLLWGDVSNHYMQLGLFVACSFGALGALDDWIKLSTSRNGLTVRQKLWGQIALALTASVILYFEHRGKPQGLDLIWPWGPWTWPLGVGFIAWSALVLVSASNAVNLTDGLDGLAAGCTVFAGLAFVALCYLAGHRGLATYLAVPYLAGSGELTVVLAATVGAVLGFLWFNCYPAQVFMGDAGALPLGGIIGLAAVSTRQELLLLVAGGVFVVETLSVLAQVGWFKLKKKRLILCSPLHNHFRFAGQHEMKIVVRFWIVAALLALVAVASLKLPRPG